jgi:hypothetical protein
MTTSIFTDNQLLLNWKRTNATVPRMLEAIRQPITLEEMTEVSQWEAPVELRHLKKMARKRGFLLTHDNGVGKERRYQGVFPRKGFVPQ